jgi:hypothetical protein
MELKQDLCRQGGKKRRDGSMTCRISNIRDLAERIADLFDRETRSAIDLQYEDSAPFLPHPVSIALRVVVSHAAATGDYLVHDPLLEGWHEFVFDDALDEEIVRMLAFGACDTHRKRPTLSDGNAYLARRFGFEGTPSATILDAPEMGAGWRWIRIVESDGKALEALKVFLPHLSRQAFQSRKGRIHTEEGVVVLVDPLEQIRLGHRFVIENPGCGYSLLRQAVETSNVVGRYLPSWKRMMAVVLPRWIATGRLDDAEVADGTYRRAAQGGEVLESHVSGGRLLSYVIHQDRQVEARFAFTDGLLGADDRPAITTSQGHYTWCREGLPHRLDGPAAVEFGVSGLERSREWFCHGMLHREDGPAREVIDGDDDARFVSAEVWYRHGRLHNMDGPAVVHRFSAAVEEPWAGHDEEWYMNGLRHNRDGGPAKVTVFAEGTKKNEWFSHGKRHRENGPAVDDRGDTEWFLNGRRHREDGPAVVSDIKEEWYRHGRKHRIDGPAFTMRLDARSEIPVEAWYLHGRLHRRGGPAVTHRPRRPSQTQFEWMLHGEHASESGPHLITADGTFKWMWNGTCHREDGPAVVMADGTEMWQSHGRLHRRDGPALLSPNGDEVWYSYGEKHREDGPAERTPNALKWFFKGALHRADGPAVVRSDGTTQWYRYGRLHRDDGPAVNFPSGAWRWFRDGTLHRADGPATRDAKGSLHWYRDGHLHRDDGPAVVRADGTSLWFRSGMLFNPHGLLVRHADGSSAEDVAWFHRDEEPGFGNDPFDPL